MLYFYYVVLEGFNFKKVFSFYIYRLYIKVIYLFNLYKGY